MDGAKLEKVINIIREGVPKFETSLFFYLMPDYLLSNQSSEEIELEIDTLPASVLTKLYIWPLRAPVTKQNRAGKGTGDLKRKSMDEDVETKKIRLLGTPGSLFESQC